MINNNLILEALRDIIHNENLDEINNKKQLSAYLKYYRTVSEVLAEAIYTSNRKAEFKEINPYIEHNLVQAYLTYMRGYEVLLSANEIVKVSSRYKDKVLKVIEQLNNVNDLDLIIEQLNSLK